MQINITGRHFDVTPALEQYVNQKMTKINRHFEQISSIHVVFGIEKLEQIAEATINIPGEKLHATTKAENMYKAVDLLIDKLDRLIIKYKEKSQDFRGAGEE